LILGALFLPQTAFADSEHWHMQLHKGLQKICKDCHLELNIFPNKELYIKVPSSEQNFTSTKKEIEKFVEGVLIEQGYDAYTVKIVRDNPVDMKKKEREDQWMLKIIDPISDVNSGLNFPNFSGPKFPITN
jgi:hypothetical protein